MAQRLALALLAIVAVAWAGGGQAATPAKRTPPAVRIVEPGSLALDYAGGLFVADRRLNRVVRIDLRSGRRRVVVGAVREIGSLAVEDMHRLYVGSGERIYRIQSGRKIFVAGTGRREHSGDGGPATAASLAGLSGFEVDHDETIAIAEYDNWIRFVDSSGTISTLAGTGQEGYAGDGGPARTALLRHPHDLALRIDREVIVADSHNGVLRRIDPAGSISTFATGFGAPIAVQGGPGDTLYVADGRANAVIRLSADGGSRSVVARASGPFGLAVGYSNFYVSELAGARRVLQVGPTGRVRVLVR